MSSSQEDNLTIYIKHEEGRNEKPILCSKDATVHNLAEAVKKHADNFPGAFDGVRTEMVDLEIYRLENGNKVILKPREKVVEYVDTELLFNIGCRIYLERIDKQITPKSVKLDYNIETLDLVNQISKSDQDLGLSSKEKEYVNKNERLIKIYEKAQQPGGVNIPLEKNKKLMDFNGKTLVYELTDPKVVMPLSSISDFIEVCNGQNIALFGEPGHGKSATINSLVRVIKGGVNLQISQTVSGSLKGTMACTSKMFKLSSSNTDNAHFTVLDIPGLTIQKYNDIGRLDKIICDILKGNFTEEAWQEDNTKLPTPKSKKHNEQKRIHAAVCVVKGIAPDTSHLSTAVRNVCTHEGCNTPFFVVVTHEDKFAEEKKNKIDIIESISTATGTDKSCIFTIANRDHLPSDQKIESDIDITREREILRLLKLILGAARNEKEKIERLESTFPDADKTKEKGMCSIQ